MKVKPTLMKGEEVRAILDGRKTMMRRPIKIQPPGPEWQMAKLLNGPKKNIGKHYWVRLNKNRTSIEEADYRYFGCPYELGDLLWVRESWWQPSNPKPGEVEYRADDVVLGCGRWKSSIIMPRHLSRLTLRVASVRAERLCDIKENDAKSEGVQPALCTGYPYHDPPSTHVNGLRQLWDSSHPRSIHKWDANPWVWAISFEPINTNVDEVLWHAW